jgi:hypothetical protein
VSDAPCERGPGRGEHRPRERIGEHSHLGQHRALGQHTLRSPRTLRHDRTWCPFRRLSAPVGPGASRRRGPSGHAVYACSARTIQMCPSGSANDPA